MDELESCIRFRDAARRRLAALRRATWIGPVEFGAGGGESHRVDVNGDVFDRVRALLMIATANEVRAEERRIRELQA